jgi:hypothetical protein
MQLTTHFTLEEFTLSQIAARQGIDNTPSVEILSELIKTAVALEDVRNSLGAPILISSGYRSLSLNRALGSKDSSHHRTGQAVDFTCPRFGSPTNVFFHLLESPIEFDQLILEYPDRGGWVHISFAPPLRHQALRIDSLGTHAIT